jgi:hypothetical protein
MTNAVTYRITPSNRILNHFWTTPKLVRDEEEDAAMLRRARIRSGDYLMTLATELERVAQSLGDVRAPEAPELERIVSELLYLERNYRIVER